MLARGFTICVLLFQAFIYIQAAGYDPVIEVAPAKISLGLTSSLEVNCTFATKNASEVATLVSLSVFRSSDSGQTFTELASITEVSSTPDIVNLAISENIQADGLINEAEDSYIHLKWEHPAERQGGLYQCSFQGIDLLGQGIIMTSSAQVSVDEPSAEELREKIRELENYTKLLEEKILLEEDNCTKVQQEMSSEINNLNKLLDFNRVRILDHFLKLPLTYSDRNYYLWQYRTVDVENSILTCNLIGGYLLEIDTAAEFQAIQGYLNTTIGFRWVMISGSDAATEGAWVLQSTNQSLPYVSWAPGCPTVNTSHNCLVLYFVDQWQMKDDACQWTSVFADNTRFICEVPQHT